MAGYHSIGNKLNLSQKEYMSKFLQYQLLAILTLATAWVIIAWKQDSNPNNHKIELGRMLFYDPILSKNNTIACASCHKQEFAFSDTARFSKGIFGKTISRNAMSLVNLKWQKRFFWDGRASSLEEQVLSPIVHPKEMGEDLERLVQKLSKHPKYPALFKKAFDLPKIDTNQISSALSSFLRSIISMNSPIDKIFEDPKNRTMDEHTNQSSEKSDLLVMKNLLENSLNSQTLFLKSALLQKKGKVDYSDRSMLVFVVCIQCHDKNFLGDPGLMKNNGLESVLKDKGLGAITHNKKDEGLFKVPTLRNIFKTPPYMHDGRFKTIDEVLDFYSTGIQDHPNLDPLLKESGKPIQFNLTKREKEEIKEFLLLAQDDSLFTSKKFSNPFLSK